MRLPAVVVLTCAVTSMTSCSSSPDIEWETPAEATASDLVHQAGSSTPIEGSDLIDTHLRRAVSGVAAFAAPPSEVVDLLKRSASGRGLDEPDCGASDRGDADVGADSTPAAASGESYLCSLTFNGDAFGSVFISGSATSTQVQYDIGPDGLARADNLT